MPDKDTEARARADERAGKSPSTQAGEFVREEIHHVREGKHGAKNAKQAIAIGLSKARRAGVDLPPPDGNTSEQTQEKAERDYERGQEGDTETSPTRSRATMNALKKESTRSTSHQAMSRQARSAARKRPASQRSASARKAARTQRRTAGSRSRTTASTRAKSTKSRGKSSARSRAASRGSRGSSRRASSRRSTKGKSGRR